MEIGPQTGIDALDPTGVTDFIDLTKRNSLTTASFIVRQSIVLDERSMVILESHAAGNRVWRVPYEQVRSLTVTQQFPIVRMLLVAMFIFLPGLLFLLIQEFEANVVAAFFLTLGFLVLAWYIVCRKTTLHLRYGTRERTLPIIARPGKVSRFVQNFTTAVQRAQAFHRQRLPQPEPPSDVFSE